MKIKIVNGLLIVDILSILLLAAVVIIPSSTIRIVLGLPFILFFPGYVLMSALIVRKHRDNLEAIALSVGLSIAVVALIGFGLNYTAWGVKLEPVLYLVSIWILVISVVALIRRIRINGSKSILMEINVNIPGLGGNAFSKSLTITLVLVILISIGSLGYVSASSKGGEKSTEFYILGIHGQAQNYPTDFVIQGNTVSEIKYGSEIISPLDGKGRIILGIINHEHEPVTYSIVMKINEQQVNIFFNGSNVIQTDNINLSSDGKWENEIGFVPLRVGDNQKVELFLTKNGNDSFEESIQFWINVRAAP